MENKNNFTIGFIGLGLMGGAFAIAIKRNNIFGKNIKIVAHDINTEVLTIAKQKGIIDKGFENPKKMLNSCNILFLCINPSDIVAFMEKWMDSFNPGTIITDIGGCKRKICEKIEKIIRDDIDFIAGHPMAGSEKTGFINAGNCNFYGKNYILVPSKKNKPENLVLLKQLIYGIGFTHIAETSAEEHDNKIAFTSQLCHVLASAMIDCEPDINIARFGGGSFEDLTRIAMLNVPMWTELFLENSDNLLQRIEQFESSLDKIKTSIAECQNKNLSDILNKVLHRRIAMER